MMAAMDKPTAQVIRFPERRRDVLASHEAERFLAEMVRELHRQGVPAPAAVPVTWWRCGIDDRMAEPISPTVIATPRGPSDTPTHRQFAPH